MLFNTIVLVINNRRCGNNDRAQIVILFECNSKMVETYFSLLIGIFCDICKLFLSYGDDIISSCNLRSYVIEKFFD